MRLSKKAQDRIKTLAQFGQVITIPCPQCGAPVGKLCDKAGFWICLERFQAYDPVAYPRGLWPS